MFIKIICVFSDLNLCNFFTFQEWIHKFDLLIFCNDDIFEWKFCQHNFLVNHLINEFHNRFESIDYFWIVPLKILSDNALV